METTKLKKIRIRKVVRTFEGPAFPDRGSEGEPRDLMVGNCLQNLCGGFSDAEGGKLSYAEQTEAVHAGFDIAAAMTRGDESVILKSSAWNIIKKLADKNREPPHLMSSMLIGVQVREAIDEAETVEDIQATKNGQAEGRREKMKS